MDVDSLTLARQSEHAYFCLSGLKGDGDETSVKSA
jgi:hypothetical protein